MSEGNELKERCKEFINRLESLKNEKREGEKHYTAIKDFLEQLDSKMRDKIEINPSLKCKDADVKPDLTIKCGDKVLAIIEFKKKGNKEFNVEILDKVKLKSDGRLPCFLQYLRGDASYPNRANDGIGQVRGYYYALMYCKKLDDNAFAVLTNGEVWVVFKFRHERDNCKILDIAEEGIDKDKDKVWCFKLCDDVDKLKDLIIKGQEPNTCNFEIEE